MKLETVPSYAGVYFVRCGRFVKIGHAHNIRHRMTEFQIAHPEPLLLVHHERVDDAKAREAREAALHDQFSSRRVRGEWFDVSDTEIVSPVDLAREVSIGIVAGLRLAFDLLVDRGCPADVVRRAESDMRASMSQRDRYFAHAWDRVDHDWSREAADAARKAAAG